MRQGDGGHRSSPVYMQSMGPKSKLPWTVALPTYGHMEGELTLSRSE